jgi:tRNA pseudouridine32 synthase/23S rRNA pseudouridine746 synthase
MFRQEETADGLLHPLASTLPLPSQLNNPFYYEADELCRKAAGEVVAWLEGRADQTFLPELPSEEFLREIGEGKMIGVLVVQTSDADAQPLAYLAGFSGQVCGRADWPGFVPAVFDYLQPDGYFRQEENRIVQINDALDQLRAEAPKTNDTPEEPRPETHKGYLEGETEEEHIRRRQHENAELHRWKLRQRTLQAGQETARQEHRQKMTALKTLRRQKSDALQRWLFSRFLMRNARGETRHLLQIFSSGGMPPAGSGECCEPRLLQYAFAHRLKPVSMAMFWWGKSPKEEIRHHLQFYPACNNKCKPILRWMLQGLDVVPNPLEAEVRQTLNIVYEDADIVVVDKPAGMLSVPGKGRRESVQSLMRQRYPDATGPLIVHRLDMATSGLLVVALTMEAYLNLQRQFAGHEIRKRYIAVLTHAPSSPGGDIALSLRPDLNDRPRQVVDEVYGRPAFTHYEQLDGCRVALYPHTGRTHQLRVHCAHQRGLDNPIKGDELYGQRADRLYLHAETLTFRHPSTGKEITFTSPAPF